MRGTSDFRKFAFKGLNHRAGGQKIAFQHIGNGGDIIVFDTLTAVRNKGPILTHRSVFRRAGHQLVQARVVKPFRVVVAGVTEAILDR